MIDEATTFKMFELFSDMPSAESQKWKWLCKNSASQLSAQLKKNIDLASNMERLCCTAAAMAYADYELLGKTSSSSAEEIKIGDISIKNSNGEHDTQNASQNIRDYFLKQIEDLLATKEIFIVPVVNIND